MTEARYLYCVANSSREITFSMIGIENNEVYTISYKDLCALIHNCPPKPYQSEDKEKVKSWIIAHEKVVESAWERFGTVLPFGFDTIIKSNRERNAEENIKNWLKNDYLNLKQKLDNLQNKAEFGVQIFWSPKIIGKRLIETNEEIKKLKEEIKSQPKGLAYMYRQKLENLIKKQMETKAKRDSKDFYERIKKCVDDIKVEKNKNSEKGKQMIMNLSCLLPKGKSRMLGKELEKINNMEEFFIRFTGPWPPYSFV